MAVKAKRTEAARLANSDAMVGNHLRSVQHASTEESLHHASIRIPLTIDRKAKIAEAAVLFRLVLHGLNPYTSAFDGDKVDWLVSFPGGRTARIEVRWLHRKLNGVLTLRLRCSNGRGKSRRMRGDEFDFVAGYDLFEDKAYVYSTAELEHVKATVVVDASAVERWDKITAGP